MALTPEQEALNFNPELQDVSRQRKLADLLMAQGMQQPQGQMISGHYVAPSWTQQLAPMANVLAGQAVSGRADTQEQQLAQTLRQVGQKEVQDILETAKTDPKAALAMSSAAQTPQGKALASSLMASVLPKKTDLIINYEAAKTDPVKPFKGSFDEWKNQLTEKDKADLALRKQEVGLSGARLNLEQQKAAFEMSNGKPLNETQAKASLYQGTMLNSTKEMNKLENSGFNPSSFKNQAALSMGSNATGNSMMPENAQRYKQASDAFANSYIRFQSGAGINQDEIQRNLKNMMPAFGDKPNTIEQKQRAREEAVRLMGNVAGSGNQLLPKNQTNNDASNLTNTVAPPKTQLDPALLQYMTPEQRKLFGA